MLIKVLEHDTIEYIRLFDVVMLSGTQTAAGVHHLQQYSAGYTFHTMHHLNWFLPTDRKSRYCFMPVAGGRMKQCLRLRLGCHDLPMAVGRRTNIDRADRVCPHCAGCVGDELHMVYECPYLQPLRLQYAHLFTTDLIQFACFLGRKTLWVVFILSWIA